MKDQTQYEKVRAFHQVMGLALDRPLNHNTVSDFVLREGLVTEEVDELWAETDTALACMTENVPVPEVTRANLLKEMVDVVYVILGFAATFGLPFDEAFNRVHESNLSKLVDGKPLKRVDGKVLKGPNYRPADLTDLVV